jgi:hypothetical protein
VAHSRASTIGQALREKPRKWGNSPKLKRSVGLSVQRWGVVPDRTIKERKGRKVRETK